MLDRTPKIPAPAFVFVWLAESWNIGVDVLGGGALRRVRINYLRVRAVRKHRPEALPQLKFLLRGLKFAFDVAKAWQARAFGYQGEVRGDCGDLGGE
jgi:hypothetical protein